MNTGGEVDEYGWLRPESAPRDGSWILLDIDDGSNDFIDGIAWSVYVGRWNPKNFPDLGAHFYEWEVVARNPHETNPPDIFSNWADGRIMGWRPIDSATSARGDQITRELREEAKS